MGDPTSPPLGHDITVEDPADERLADYADLIDAAEHGDRRLPSSQRFVVEGFNVVLRLLESEHSVRSVLATPSAAARLHDAVAALPAGAVRFGGPVLVAAPDVLRRVVGFDFHRGVLASVDRPAPTSTVETSLARAQRVVLLEGVGDPENVGAIARTARAFGADTLGVDPATADPYFRRSVRVSMGEILHLRVVRTPALPSVLTSMRSLGFVTIALTPAATATDMWDFTAEPLARIAVALGAEGPGLSAATMAMADHRLRIPIHPGVDSLNVGHAAAIALAHIFRNQCLKSSD